MVLSQEHVAKRVEFGEKSHALTTPSCSLRQATSSPLTPPCCGNKLQTRTVSSEELVATCEPSWENEAVHTLLVCPRREMWRPLLLLEGEEELLVAIFVDLW